MFVRVMDFALVSKIMSHLICMLGLWILLVFLRLCHILYVCFARVSKIMSHLICMLGL